MSKPYANANTSCFQCLGTFQVDGEFPWGYRVVLLGTLLFAFKEQWLQIKSASWDLFSTVWPNEPTLTTTQVLFPSLTLQVSMISCPYNVGSTRSPCWPWSSLRFSRAILILACYHYSTKSLLIRNFYVFSKIKQDNYLKYSSFATNFWKVY